MAYAAGYGSSAHNQYSSSRSEASTPYSMVSATTEPTIHDDDYVMAGGLHVPGLESAQNSRILDIVDRVRQIDIDRRIELPQIVVSGDQSSGKSSALEAITGIPFPRAEGTCTKFATEIILRREETQSALVKIRPDPKRADKAALSKFIENVTDFRQLPDIMRRASALILRNDRGPQTFSRDVLEVHVNGPEVHPFTIIDLPGLVRNEKHPGDREVVERIVDSYISQSRSIILAVLAANYDADNQGILSMSRTVDRDGSRTLGIITKPDQVEVPSATLNKCIRMAQNQDPEYHFKLGWHVIKNRNASETDRGTSGRERDRSEVQFFQDPARGWSSLPSEFWGVQSLRHRLTTLLESHTRKHLPAVLEEVNKKLDANKAEIDALTPYSSPEELHKRFRKICRDMTAVAEKGISGKSHSKWFRLDTPERWIRSEVNKLNEEFDTTLRLKGHNPDFEWDGDTVATGMSNFQNFVHDFLRWSRGQELPGSIDPQRKDQIFWHLSDNWHGIARSHTLNAYDRIKRFLDLVIDSHIGSEFPHAVTRIQQILIDDLRARQISALGELEKLENDRNKPARTLNASYLRQREDQLALLAFRNATHINRASATLPSGYTAKSVAELTGINDIEKSRFSKAEEFYLEILIHYKIARDVFVDNIETQVIERHLLDSLQYIFDDLSNKSIKEVELMLKDDNHEERERRRQDALNRRRQLEEIHDALASA